jgi:hypothetical protein
MGAPRIPLNGGKPSSGEPVFYHIDVTEPEWYIGGMKVKTSVTLSQELLKVVDRRARQHKKNRSDFIETAVWTFLAQLSREEINARDLEIINRHAEALNREAADVLSYQAPI